MVRSHEVTSEWEELVVRGGSKLRKEKTSFGSRVRRRWERVRGRVTSRNSARVGNPIMYGPRMA